MWEEPVQPRARVFHSGFRAAAIHLPVQQRERDDVGDPRKSKPPLDRRWPILMYGGDVAVGLFFLVEGVRRHCPFGAVIGAVVFLLF